MEVGDSGEEAKGRGGWGGGGGMHERDRDKWEDTHWGLEYESSRLIHSNTTDHQRVWEGPPVCLAPCQAITAISFPLPKHHCCPHLADEEIEAPREEETANVVYMPIRV